MRRRAQAAFNVGKASCLVRQVGHRRAPERAGGGGRTASPVVNTATAGRGSRRLQTQEESGRLPAVRRNATAVGTLRPVDQPLEAGAASDVICEGVYSVVVAPSRPAICPHRPRLGKPSMRCRSGVSAGNRAMAARPVHCRLATAPLCADENMTPAS